ncbi:low-density lipoprotein receptor-related protein 4-like isoform X1 [Lytechinus variegatus]|uniref:low-density lipoprotein receptor-related protein 4-like isoform X1 n=2 Tax=Lytechinus variegatus TaxID=7654 RepID=UPI001BB24336|nr:low-density lipoprotein receptor-related protein 4-like isoform X1 [Lytechinus variegatus]
MIMNVSGQSYSKALYGRCLEDEYSCEDLCLPLSWQCDGLPDCPDQSDELNCDPTEDAGPLMFLTSLSGGAIYVSHANSLDFRKLPFLFVESPVAVGYDVIGKDVYWTDVERKVLNAAQMDGSNQRIVAQGLGVPDGLFVDSENGVIFWTDAQLKTIETIEFDGSNQRVLINDLDMPRAIIVVPTNDKLYWTDWGTTPNIEMSNRDGSDRQVIIDTELGWPNGITYDIKGHRLIWCDARLDKIETSDLDGSLRRTLLGVTHGVLHPFGVVVYDGTLVWSDWILQGVGIMEGQNHTWPSLYTSIRIIQQPSGFCIVVDACSAGPCKFGTCQPFNVSNYECHCMTGYTGKNCDTEVTCDSPTGLSSDTYIADPKDSYSPGENVVIVCNGNTDNETARTTWICNGSTGEWDMSEDLKCLESPKNSITLTLGIMSSLATLVLVVIVVFGICTCMTHRDQSPVNNRTTPKQVDDRGPLPCVPSDINEDYHYYSGLTDPTSDHGHIYMTSLADKTQRDTLDSRYSYLRPNSTA